MPVSSVATAHVLRSPRTCRGVVIVLALQVAAMLALAATLGTWTDEEYSLGTTAHGTIYAFHRAIEYELQAPLYFVALAALRVFSQSVFFARALSVLCAVGFTYAMTLVERRIAPARNAWLFAALVAINPFTVFAALEIRLYAFALLLCALCWLAFYDGYFAGHDRRSRFTFIALALVSLYTQYFIAFEFVGFAVGLAVMGRWRSLRAYMLAASIVAVGFVPMLIVLHAQVSGAFAVRDMQPPSFGSIFLHPLIDFVFPAPYRAVDGVLAHISTLLRVCAIIAAVVVCRPRVGRLLSAYVAMVVTIYAIYVVLADGFKYELIVPRHFVAIFVPELVAAYAIVMSFQAARRRGATALILVIYAAAAVASNASMYPGIAKQGDWKRVGAYLAQVARPGDTIAIYGADALPAFRRYYGGPAHVVPFPRVLPPDRYDVDAMFVHSVAEGEAALARLPQTDRVWFVDYGVCDRFDLLGCNEAYAAIVRREEVLERKEFFRNLVLRLAPKQHLSTGAR